MTANAAGSQTAGAADTRSMENEEQSGPANEQPRVLVLIAEDEQPIAEVLALIVEDAGYEPMIAAHGKAALKLIQSSRPALVITDLMMPYLDGRSFITQLRAEAERAGWPPIPVILMTAADLAYAYTCGADAVLAKPFSIQDVERVMHQLLPNAMA